MKPERPGLLSPRGTPHPAGKQGGGALSRARARAGRRFLSPITPGPAREDPPRPRSEPGFRSCEMGRGHRLPARPPDGVLASEMDAQSAERELVKYCVHVHFCGPDRPLPREGLAAAARGRATASSLPRVPGRKGKRRGTPWPLGSGGGEA